MLILGIETSCDDTCAAVVQDDYRVLSSVVSSQESLHSKYGGIVPELASRRHVECMIPMIEEALDRATCQLDQMDGIAVTHAPGLIGSLLVGLSTAKAIAFGRSIPLIPVHHLHGHLVSPGLSRFQVPYPHLGLVISGGHTALYRLDSPLEIKFLGGTRDDAVGEAFDKVGKCLGLPFPGGPHIEKRAAEYSGELISFPIPRFKKNGIQFSFSGLKTAVAQYVHREQEGGREVNVPLVSQSFQQTVIEILAEQTRTAIEAEQLNTLTVSGGVAANGAIRQCFEQLLSDTGGQAFFAEKKFCTDNAAMIAAVGSLKLKNAGENAKWPMNVDAFAQLPLGK